MASIQDRVLRIGYELFETIGRATTMHEEQYAIGRELLDPELVNLRAIVTQEIPALEPELERPGAPWTAGRLPE